MMMMMMMMIAIMQYELMHVSGISNASAKNERSLAI